MALRASVLRVKRFHRDRSGATAVEFSIVAVPFLMLIFALIEVALVYFGTIALENATDQAARCIRTGQAAQAEITKAEFKDIICQRGAPFFKCNDKLRVDIQSGTTFATLAPTSALDMDGKLKNDAAFSGNSSSAGEFVLVTAYYEWDITQIVPFIDLSNMANGNRLLSAVTSFRNEPFEVSGAKTNTCGDIWTRPS